MSEYADFLAGRAERRHRGRPRGRTRARAERYNGRAEYSGSQTLYDARRPLPGCTPGEGSTASRSTDEMPR